MNSFLSLFDNPFGDSPLGATLVSAVAVLGGFFLLWLVLLRWSAKAKRHIQSLIVLAQNASSGSSSDAGAQTEAAGELDAARRKLTALRLVTNGARYALCAAVLLTFLRMLKVPLDSLLLPAGFLGAALGLGAQNLVRDFVSGLFFVFEGQFSVGDAVTINDKTGIVDEVGLRVTKLRDESGVIHYFPNGAINNVSKFPRTISNLVVNVPLADAGASDTAVTVICESVNRFGHAHDVLVRPLQTDESFVIDEHGILRILLPARPTRVAAVREKLPAFLMANLEANSIKLQSGDTISVSHAASS